MILQQLPIQNMSKQNKVDSFNTAFAYDKRILLPAITGDYYESVMVEYGGRHFMIPRGAPVNLPPYVVDELRKMGINFDELE